jgi:hypothetical protein
VKGEGLFLIFSFQMQYIIQIFILFVLIGSVLKLSFWKFWQAALFGCICAGFIVVSCRWAILQSKTQWDGFLGNAAVMQDAAVWISIESTLCFAFCFVELGHPDGGEGKKRWKRLLRWYPGLLLFPALFYLQTQLIFALPGISFTALSYVFAAGVLVALPLLSRLAKRLYSERDGRLEVYFLANLFICLIGLISTVNGNTNYPAVKEPLNLKALLWSLGLFAGFFIAGILLNKLKYRPFKSHHTN